jgi:hypothetical protein
MALEVGSEGSDDLLHAYLFVLSQMATAFSKR